MFYSPNITDLPRLNIKAFFPQEKDFLSSGLFGIDYISGGGYPIGEITEVFGDSGSGKTAIALKSIATAQKQGKSCAFIDMDRAFPMILAKNTGVDTSSLLVFRPDSAEDAFDIMSTLIRTDALSLIVLDSVASLLPKEDLDHAVSKQKGALPKILQEKLPDFISLVKTTKTAVLFLNQTRERVSRTGATTSSLGGKMLKYYAELRIETTCGELLKQNGNVIGQSMNCTAIKNLSVFPGRSASFDVFHSSGADDVRFFADAAERMGFLSFSEHATILFDRQEFRSYKELRHYLEEHPDISAKIKTEIVREGRGEKS